MAIKTEGPAAAFARAVKALVRAEPWRILTPDVESFAVTCPALDLHDAIVHVTGDADSFAFSVCWSADDFQVYLDSANLVATGADEVPMPRHLAVMMEGDEPIAFAAEDFHTERDPTKQELVTLEAIARALNGCLSGENDFTDGEVERTLKVGTHEGPVELTLRWPYDRTPARPKNAVLAELHDLAGVDDRDHDRRLALENEILAVFSASPEARPLQDREFPRIVMDLAARFHGATLATLGARQLRDVMLEGLPRKAAFPSGEVPRLVAELRAFYEFLKREYELEQADTCLLALGPGTVVALRHALDDPEPTIPAPEDIEAWIKSRARELMPQMMAAGASSSTRPVGQVANRATKNKRKAARKARKKNRN